MTILKQPNQQRKKRSINKNTQKIFSCHKSHTNGKRRKTVSFHSSKTIHSITKPPLHQKSTLWYTPTQIQQFRIERDTTQIQRRTIQSNRRCLVRKSVMECQRITSTQPHCNDIHTVSTDRDPCMNLVQVSTYHSQQSKDMAKDEARWNYWEVYGVNAGPTGTSYEPVLLTSSNVDTTFTNVITNAIRKRTSGNNPYNTMATPSMYPTYPYIIAPTSYPYMTATIPQMDVPMYSTITGITTSTWTLPNQHYDVKFMSLPFVSEYGLSVGYSCYMERTVNAGSMWLVSN